MILEFTVENFRSIKEPQTLSFVPDSSEHLRENLLSTEARPDIQLLPSLFVYGGNGAGKTNLCAALSAFCWLALYSSQQLTLGDPIAPVQAFRLDSSSAAAPSVFSMTFLIGEHLFEYRVSCSHRQIEQETLRRKANTSKSRWATVFDRAGQERSSWTGNAPRLNQSFFKSVRDNGTVLSKAAQENISAVNEVFRAILNISVRDMSREPDSALGIIGRLLEQYPPLREWLAPIVRCADVRFESVRVINQEVAEAELPRDRPDLFAARRSGHTVYRMDLEFVRRGPDGTVATFALEDVSGGTKRFLALVLEVFDAARLGSLLVLDEFDSSLHPLLANQVRDLLTDPEVSSRAGAQFLVVTHNDTMLDSSSLRRDQIVFLNQTDGGETEWYAMADLDRLPKPNESFQKRYLLGGYGGIPRVGDLRSMFSNMVREWESDAVQA